MTDDDNGRRRSRLPEYDRHCATNRRPDRIVGQHVTVLHDPFSSVQPLTW